MILGIDPGLANTGWAVLDVRSQFSDLSSQISVLRSENIQESQAGEYKLVECGCLRTNIGEASARRLEKIYDELERLM